MTVEICIAQNDDAKEWDTIVSESPHGTIFHHWDWLKITEKHTDSRLYPFICKKGNTVVGIFPLFFQKRGPVRMVFSPPPNAALFYLGPVLVGYNRLSQEKKETVYSNFLNSVENFIKKDLSADYIRISLSPALQDPRPFTWSGYTIEPNYDYKVDLTKGIDILYKSLNNRQRADIKNANDMGMKFEIGTKKEFEKILDLMEIRYRQQGKSVTPSRDYLSDIFDKYQDNLKIFVIKIEDEVVTGAIRINYGDSLYGWIGNPKPKNRMSPSPNHLLFWETVRYASGHGFKNYITMSAAGDERLHTYYASRFNPELLIRYSAIKKSFIGGISEKGYIHIIKPLKEMMKNLMSDE